MIRLGVNVDHVATVRQARRTIEPDPVHAAVLCLLAGADSITVHLREDRRHIQERDVRLLRPVVPKLNLELAAADDVVSIACEVRPDQATLVPERREELTTEGGLDVVANRATLQPVVDRLKAAGIEVVFFVDPDERQIDASAELGAKAVEIQTAAYSEARQPDAIADQLELLRRTSAYAEAKGLHVHMGHGLTYTNIQPILSIPQLEEVNIGHSIVSRAVLVGMERAVREMKNLLDRAD